MRRPLSWLWKVESRWLIWLLGLTFALIVTFQYVELPYSISSIFSSTKIPISRNSASLISNLSPAMAPSVSQTNFSLGTESKSETNPIFDGNGTATAPAISPTNAAFLPSLPTLTENAIVHVASAEVPAASPGLNPSPAKEKAIAPVANAEALVVLPSLNLSLVKENATASVTSAKAPAPLPGLVPSPVKENATAPGVTAKAPAALPTSQVTKRNATKTDGSDASPIVRFVPDVEENAQRLDSRVMSLSDMTKQLRQNRISQNHLAKKPKWVTKPDMELLQAKYEIENAPLDDKDPNFYSPLYLNVSVFKRSYELMEKMLKVYVYKEGKKPIMHNPYLTGVYSSEGWFMKLIESNNKFVTKDPAKAHLFYLPFSTRMLEDTLYVKDSHSNLNLVKYLKDYLDFISVKYPFWNRTSGADHFFAACHDWAPAETRTYFAKSIRGLCNTDVKEGFVFGKDTSLPEAYVSDPRKPVNNIGGNSASQRPILAFFAGKLSHGYLRNILLSYWGNNKDPDLKIFGKLPRMKGNKNYLHYMKTSKYCICAKGFEVNSPRVVEAIFYECVPVIISDNFVPPFFEVLNWESFAVFVREKDIPNLKTILMSISERRYLQMQMRVKKVQKHFLWHLKPEKYDMFHMILHSFWFNRVFQISV